MFKYILRRIFFMIVTMLIVSVAVFVLIESSPGNMAKNFLGPYITLEQEKAFLAKMGLDKPLYVRYLYWLVGNDFTAESKIGMPLKKIITKKGFREWWVVGEKGNLLRWELKDGELYAFEKQPDGSIIKYVDNERYNKPNLDGTSFFWGVNRQNRAVRWEKGGTKKTIQYILKINTWKEVIGGPIEFIPLKKGILRGDPGLSLQTSRPVFDTLWTRVRNSAVFAGIGFFLIMPMALLLGVIAALKEGSLRDRTLSLGGIFFAVTPEFISGIFLIMVFGIWLRWVPAVTVFGEAAPWERLDMLILPVITLTLTTLGYVLRITRASMVEVMRSQYIRTAFLKGLPYWQVIFKHALRNALIAPITVIMMHLSWLLGGLVVIEVVFGYPGLGKYLLDCAITKDYNALETATMVMVGVAVTTQLIADILYTLVNPRIRYK
jgi:peptide/nickel transport system permease protein